MPSQVEDRPATAGPLRRTQARRRAEAEGRLLDAAAALIAERGLERFTLAEVGLAAGYSAGLPAHYFGRKEVLVAAVARRIIGDFGAALEKRLRLQPGLDGLMATAGFYFESAAAHPQAARALAVLLGEAFNRPELAAAVAGLNRLSAGEIERQLRYGVEQGRIRADVDPPSQAVIILAGLRGAVAQWLIDPDHLSLADLSEAFLLSLKRSLAP